MPYDGIGQLATAVITLAAGAERSHDPQLAGAARRCAQRLRSPLRIALVGRAKTGKSTLLNALLGTAVAPTDAGECTKVVHRFRHDQFTTASLVTRTGRSPVPVRFTGSRLPTQLELPASEIKYVDVTLPVPLLRRATLIDTPGLASPDTDISEVTARMMDDYTNDSAAHADALLYCVRDTLQQEAARRRRGASPTQRPRREPAARTPTSRPGPAAPGPPTRPLGRTATPPSRPAPGPRPRPGSRRRRAPS
jgi:hypothetical protein